MISMAPQWGHRGGCRPVSSGENGRPQARQLIGS